MDHVSSSASGIHSSSVEDGRLLSQVGSNQSSKLSYYRTEHNVVIRWITSPLNESHVCMSLDRLQPANVSRVQVITFLFSLALTHIRFHPSFKLLHRLYLLCTLCIFKFLATTPHFPHQSWTFLRVLKAHCNKNQFHLAFIPPTNGVWSNN